MGEVKNVSFTQLKRSFVFDVKMNRMMNEEGEDVFKHKFEVRGDLKAFLEILELGSELMRLNLRLLEKSSVENEANLAPAFKENLQLLKEYFQETGK